MSYQVLARKWRPKNFAEVIGQEHVLRALINALDNNRLHHAYLFTGTRGVGKTTLGRILAKSLNCEHGVSSQPCGQCSACMEIDEGRFVDLLEVDAASRTKVEDTRDLLENVQYAPTRGRFKVYLIDEVHMLSNHSFNALLKTLEEPPPHVKFLLATTDPQKLPVTILSRCLKFNLKFIPVDRIQAHLENVLQQEGVNFETSALHLLAKSAAGSMRDALSLTDQAIAHGSGQIREEEVQAMLGTLNRDEVIGVLQALAKQDGAAVLEEVNRLAQFGVDFTTILSELVSLLHQLALVQISGSADDESAQALTELASSISPEDVQLYYQIAIQGLRDLPIVPDGRAGFEMIVLRMLAFKPESHASVSQMPTQETITQPQVSTTKKQVETPPAPAADSRQTAKANLNAMLGRNKKEPPAPQLKTEIKNTEPAKEVLETESAKINNSVVSEQSEPPPIDDDVPPPGFSEPPPIDDGYAESVGERVNDNVMEAPADPQTNTSSNTNKPQSWSEVVAVLPLNGMARQVAANSVVSKREGQNIYLAIKESHSQMVSKAILSRLEEALSEFYKRPLKVHLVAGQLEQETPAQQYERETKEKLNDAVQRFSQDPAVQTMKNTFDAELDPESVKLID